MEIDFLIRKKDITSRHNIEPIEVKSSNSYTTVSLNKFRKKYGSYLGRSYILHTGDLKIEDDIIHLPIYMSGLL